jgi:hypothetical protein
LGSQPATHSRKARMQGNIETAAKWFGLSLLLTSAILVGGIHFVVTDAVRKLAEAMVQAGRASQPPAQQEVRIPNKLTVTHQFTGETLSQRLNVELNPVRPFVVQPLAKDK